jgi:hypothetical protein
LGDIKTNIAENRVRTKVSEPYKNVLIKLCFDEFSCGRRNRTLEVAEYVEAFRKINGKLIIILVNSGRKSEFL